jgi:photosystem II stability/assembly factor-like uncharacterized protein
MCFSFKIIPILAVFVLACSGSAKVTQGNDGSSSLYKPNNLTSASAEISASSGGYINVGKAQLVIPAQALDSDTTITAEVADITLPEGGAKAMGKGIRLKPEGLQFLKPAELMLCYTPAEAANLNAQGTKIYYHTEDNQYVAIAGSVDTNTNCVRSHIEHFSSYVAAAFSQLPGNMAPVIGGANFLPATPLAGIPLRIRTIIDDTNGSTPVGTTVPGTVVTAFLYYRTVGSPTFTKVALQPDSTDDTVTNRYYFQVPAAEVTTAGIQYYFEATDNLNVTRRLPAAAGTFSTRAVPSAATAIRLNPTGTLQISAGFSRALTLQATDNGTTWQNISADNFALTNSSLGDIIRTAPSTVRFNAIGAGAGQVTSTIGAFSAATNLNVVPGLLTRIEITDTNQVALTGTLELPTSQIYSFDVVGYDSYGNVAQIYPVFTTTGGIGNVSVDLTGAHFNPAATVASGSIVANLAGLTDTLNISLYTPPQVTATAPFDNTTGIALNASIGVSFSHVMDTSTLTTGTTTACIGSLQVSSDNFVTCLPMASATPAFHASNTLAVIQPAANLLGSTTYKIRVTTAARNTAGYPIAAVFTTLTGFTTVTVAVPAGWYAVPSGVSSLLKTVAFVPGTQIAYAAADNGEVIRSNDLGESWSLVASAPVDAHYNIRFYSSTGGVLISSNHIYGISSANTTPVFTDITNNAAGICNDFRFQTVFSATHYTIACANGVIQTLDGGLNWSQILSGLPVVPGAMAFKDTMNGVLRIGNTIYKTVDGGANWTSVFINGLVLVGFSWDLIYLGNDAVISGGNFTSSNGIPVRVSTDGGNTFALPTIPSLPATIPGGLVALGVRGLTSPGGNTVFGVASRSGTGNLIIRSDDGGLNWVEQISPVPHGLFGVSFANPMVGLAVGANGAIIKTQNGGF